MTMRWRLAGWRPRQQRDQQRNATHSRPRVARAAEAARIAQEGVGWNLGSATAGVGVMLTPVAAPFFTPAFTPTLTPAFRMSAGEAAGMEYGVAPELILATNRAAQALGRAPEDVWTEALRAWLGVEGPAARSARPAIQEVRRAQAWTEIDETLHELRAG
jgi:hypothetical protein